MRVANERCRARLSGEEHTDGAALSGTLDGRFVDRLVVHHHCGTGDAHARLRFVFALGVARLEHMQEQALRSRLAEHHGAIGRSAVKRVLLRPQRLERHLGEQQAIAQLEALDERMHMLEQVIAFGGIVALAAAACVQP